MAFNQLIRFSPGAANPDDGYIVVGQTDLAAVGSTGISGICLDHSGNLFATDEFQHLVLKIDLTGNITVLAGTAGSSGNNGAGNPVTGADALFNGPQGICCDPAGVLYVADTGNNQIRRIDTDWNVSLFAGGATGASGFADGTSALFNQPHGIAVDSSGFVYVADTENHAVRKIVGPNTFTIAGNGSPGYVSPAQGESALLNTPIGIAVNRTGQVFVADSKNARIRVIHTDGNVYTFAGSGTVGTSFGTAATAQFLYLRYMSVDRTGNLYAIDELDDTSRLLKIDQNGNVAAVVVFLPEEDAYPVSVTVDQSGGLYVTESVADVLESSDSSI